MTKKAKLTKDAKAEAEGAADNAVLIMDDPAQKKALEEHISKGKGRGRSVKSFEEFLDNF